jgi:hypothetical protein
MAVTLTVIMTRMDLIWLLRSMVGKLINFVTNLIKIPLILCLFVCLMAFNATSTIFQLYRELNGRRGRDRMVVGFTTT